jgi:DNA-binding transcriptional MerR regulator
MSPTTRSTQEVADDLRVPYTTLLKWQVSDGLLKPIPGLGGRRGGDKWPRAEVQMARVVAQLRDAGLPVRFIKTVIDALRIHRGPKIEPTVYLAVHVREAADQPDRRIALLRVDGRKPLRDATQLSCL